MGETWFTSDTHLNHAKVAQTRGFGTVEDHDAAILTNLVKQVRPGDRLFLMGDLVMGEDKPASLAKLADATVGRGVEVCVILGNHDRPHPMFRNGHRHLPQWTALFGPVTTTAAIRHNGETVLLSHFPYDGEGATRQDEDDRATQWRMPDQGAPLIHGHVHDTVRFRTSRLGSPMFHVGLDAWGLKPVRLADLISR